MAKIKITTAFRLKGKAYGVMEKAGEVNDEAADFALAHDFGVDPVAEAEAKAKAEAEANKNKGNAPENK